MRITKQDVRDLFETVCESKGLNTSYDVNREKESFNLDYMQPGDYKRCWRIEYTPAGSGGACSIYPTVGRLNNHEMYYSLLAFGIGDLGRHARSVVGR